jgi:hypothetical protein
MSERRAYHVNPNSVSQEVHEVAKNALAISPIPGVDSMPVPIPGESQKEYRRRMQKERHDAEHGILTGAENADALNQAFALFCDGYEGNKRPTVTEVGMKLGMNLPKLVQVALDKNWEGLRANKDAASALAVNEGRLQIVKVIDRVLITKSEQIILKAATAYEEIVARICEESLDGPEQPTARETPIEPADGLPIPKPGASAKPQKPPSLMNAMWKTNALNAAVKGYFDMMASAKNVGLIIMPEDQDSDNGKKPIENNRLINLNITLAQARKVGAEVNVTPNA